MARPSRAAPRTFSDEWPNRQCADQVAEIARLFAVNLRNVTDTLGVRETARRTGVDHSTVSRILAGEAWPDLATIARLEVGLRTRLWPNHLP